MARKPRKSVRTQQRKALERRIEQDNIASAETHLQTVREASDPALVKLMRSHSPAVLAGVVSLPPGTGKSLMPKYNMVAAARTCFESWVRECGYANDARIPAWEKLKTFQRARWRAVAADVIAAATGVISNTT